MVSNLFMANMFTNFKIYFAVTLILLFSQQGFAAYKPMNCDAMGNTSVVILDNSSHVTSNMIMHDHGSLSTKEKASHEECDVCNAGSCVCSEMGGCFGSSASSSAQTTEQISLFFVDNGNKITSSDLIPDSGVYQHRFKPPIHA